MSDTLKMMQDLLPEDWHTLLKGEFDQPYMHQLAAFLNQRQTQGATIYPATQNWFSALSHTAVADVRVVILGQDPYHGPGQAHGLSFSVPEGIRLPPSLRNIYKELARDFDFDAPASGDLTPWADQGVLLLNATLTVEAGKAGSHQKQGWEIFTDHMIHTLSQQGDGIVFMLWGAYAQSKEKLIDASRHLVLQAPHPSPLSAHRGFIGCGHFSTANRWLFQHGKQPVQWANDPKSLPQLSLL